MTAPAYGAGETRDLAAALLDIARRFPRQSGEKDEAIRRELGMTPSRFHMLLNRVIETDDANRLDPALCRRLRDQRDGRVAEKIASLHGTGAAAGAGDDSGRHRLRVSQNHPTLDRKADS